MWFFWGGQTKGFMSERKLGFGYRTMFGCLMNNGTTEAALHMIRVGYQC